MTRPPPGGSHEWQPLIDFLAPAMGKPRLYQMADPFARINVMAYRTGEELNGHFDCAQQWNGGW